MGVTSTRRTRGNLAGFENSADLGGLRLPGGKTVPARRVIRADTAEHLTPDELLAVRAFGFGAVLDLRSDDERRRTAHPLEGLPGYQPLPLIDPAAEAREDFSRLRSLGDIYSTSLQRNAEHLARIFAALATSRGPVLISCRAGRDRIGMVVALLLELVGVDREAIKDDYAQ